MGLVFHLHQQPKLLITPHAQVLLDDRCSVFHSHSLVEQIHPCLKLKCLKKNLVKSWLDEKYDVTIMNLVKVAYFQNFLEFGSILQKITILGISVYADTAQDSDLTHFLEDRKSFQRINNLSRWLNLIKGIFDQNQI